MAAYPYMPVYWKDWLTGQATTAMTVEQEGAFFRLLLHAWEATPPCTLPNDPTILAGLSKLGRRWKSAGTFVMAQFEVTEDGRLRNRKQWEVRQDMEAHSERRRQAGSKGNEARWGSQRDRTDVASGSQCDPDASRKPIANPSPASAVAVPSALPGRPQDPGDTETPGQPPAVAPAPTRGETPPAADGQAGDWRHKVSDPDENDPDLVAEMRADADAHAETLQGTTRRKFEALASMIASGDDSTAWVIGATGSATPWKERPRIFRVALQLLKAGERDTVRGALVLAIQQQLDPLPTTTSAELNGRRPKASRNGTAPVDELPGGDRAGQRGTSHDLQPMGKPEGDAVLERQQEERRLISAYLEEHPDERTELERQVESWLKSIPGADKLPAVIVSGKTAGKLRELVLERIRLRTPALA